MGNLINVLHGIQTALKVPKDQWNAFGKYPYRNAESILQSVKPLLPDGVVVLCDVTAAPYEVAGTMHVACLATATLKSADEEIRATAYAVEPLEKKGMDAAQLSGATISYAKKYALANLFAIDGTKDSDAMEQQYQQPAQQPYQQQPLYPGEYGGYVQ